MIVSAYKQQHAFSRLDAVTGLKWYADNAFKFYGGSHPVDHIDYAYVAYCQAAERLRDMAKAIEWSYD